MFLAYGRSFGRAALGLACLASALVPSTAAACGACFCEIPRGIRPHLDTIEKVPRNARFLVELRVYDFLEDEEVRFDVTDVRFTKVVTGENVAFELVETDGDADQVWLVPAEALQANSDYRIEVGAEGEEAIFTESVRTSGAIDDEPPIVVEPTVLLEYPSPACGAFDGARIVFGAIEDQGSAVTYDPVVRLQVERGAEEAVLFLDAAGLRKDKAIELVMADPSNTEAVHCWDSAALPFKASDEPLIVKATVYDRAGNGTTLPPFEVTLGANDGATCPDGTSEKDETAFGADGTGADGNCGVASTRSSTHRYGWFGVLVLGLAATAHRRRRAAVLASQREGCDA